MVYREDGVLKYKDEYNWNEAVADERNLLVTVFKDGKLVKEQTLQEIREVLNGGNF